MIDIWNRWAKHTPSDGIVAFLRNKLFASSENDEPVLMFASSASPSTETEDSETEETTTYTCPTCGKTYTSLTWYNKHLLTHDSV